MFPVPSHLPRGGGEHLSSDQRAPDPTLDLLEPLLSSPSSRPQQNGTAVSSESGPSRVIWSSDQVQAVKQNLEAAIQDNKSRGHQLLVDDFPAISTHIRLGDEVRGDFTRISKAISKLEQELDPEDEEISFLPPVITTLDRHFTAHQARARSHAHIEALRALESQVGRLQKLEDAIWAGRGADDWVVDDLAEINQGRLDGIDGSLLRGTKISRMIDDRLNLLRSMLVEQLTDSFNSAVSFASQTEDRGASLAIHAKGTLQLPRLPRPEAVAVSLKPTKPPPYSLEHIYAGLARLSSLVPLFHNVRTRLIRDFVEVTVSGSHRISTTRSDGVSTLQIEAVESTLTPDMVLDGLNTILLFVGDQLFPPSRILQDQRHGFLSEVQAAILQIMLKRVILPAMPALLTSVPVWLELVQKAVDIESQLTPQDNEIDSATADNPKEGIIRAFFLSEAGRAWATQRRKRVAEEVRRMIVGGWGGWETVESLREKEVVAIVEVEVSDDEGEEGVHGVSANDNGIPTSTKEPSEEKKGDEDEFGWDFDDQAEKSAVAPGDGVMDVDPNEMREQNGETGDKSMDVDDAWGFDEAGPAESGPSKPHDAPNPIGDTSTDDSAGWDFNLDSASEPPKPVSPIIAKPAREAKKLGRKVARQKTVGDDDPWGSGSEALSSQGGPSRTSQTNGHGLDPAWEESARPSMNSKGAETNRSPVGDTSRDQQSADTADDWAWDDEDRGRSGRKESLGRKKKRKRVLKEEKRMMTETFLVSRACEKLIDAAERVLREARDLDPSSLASPSFSSAEGILLTSTTDIFDLYRSILPTHYSTQVRDVPTIAMQVYNDARHLATRVASLQTSFPLWMDAQKTSEKMSAFSDHIYESQLIHQRETMMESLDEVKFGEVGKDSGMKHAERVLDGLVHSVESLSRILKVVLPMTTYISMMGYLIDEIVRRISGDILELQDITEIESNRLEKLLKRLHPFEEVFILEPGQPSSIVAQVPHWLKFCYLSELLKANLVDILYLFDSGALIDFTTEELVQLIRALFADSEKRDDAIEKIETGREKALGVVQMVA